MGALESTSKKRKPRRKPLLFNAYVKKYTPLYEIEEAADGKVAEGHNRESSIVANYGGAAPAADLHSIDHWKQAWEQASRSALARVLRRAIADKDIEAIKVGFMTICEKLHFIPPDQNGHHDHWDEVWDALFKPWPKNGKRGRRPAPAIIARQIKARTAYKNLGFPSKRTSEICDAIAKVVYPEDLRRIESDVAAGKFQATSRLKRLRDKVWKQAQKIHDLH